MITIGKFAKLCNVNTQTLRYYDSIGLLCADIVDEKTGYRYYKPEKLELFREIIKLKELDFSLDEIKSILNSPYDRGKYEYAAKKDELSFQLLKLREKISQLDKLSRIEGAIPAKNILSELKFVDEPAVVGKWELCGIVNNSDESIERVLNNDIAELPQEIKRQLFFLPGGAFYWMFCWTKGILYRIDARLSALVPNRYELLSYNGGQYMLINWTREEYSDGKATVIRVMFRQLDNVAYTEEDTVVCRDDTSLPYISDPSVTGEWETCDLVPSLKAFKPDKRYAQETELYVLGMSISERGICVKKLRGEKGSYQKLFTHTKGYIIDKANCFTERYILDRYGSDEYLFTEHKSADYRYSGKIHGYYVFRRKKA